MAQIYATSSSSSHPAEVARHHLRPLGSLLVEDGKLTSTDIEKVQGLQRKERILFGQAAVKLGFIKPRDVERALSRQFNINYLVVGDSKVSDELFCAYYPTSPKTEAIRQLRNTLLISSQGQEYNSRMLAITSPHRQDGRSVLAANLAITFAQIGKRTLLIDADLRNPRQHALFGHENCSGLSNILINPNSTEIIKNVGEWSNLFLLTAGACPPTPQELLARETLSHVVNVFRNEFDIVLIDTPAVDEHGDADIVTARAGSALIVVREHTSQASSVNRMIKSLSRAQVNVLGCIYNRF